jgi:hypothetical protein
MILETGEREFTTCAVVNQLSFSQAASVNNTSTAFNFYFDILQI